MYQNQENLRAPEFLRVPPFFASEEKVTLFYEMVSRYKRWLLGIDSGHDELMSSMHHGTFSSWIPALMASRDDHTTEGVSNLAEIARTIADDTDTEAEKLAHKWARSRIDEAFANRRNPDYVPPLEKLEW